VGIEQSQFFPPRPSEFVSLRQQDIGPVGNALQISGHEMHFLRTRRPWPHPAILGGKEIVHGFPSLPLNRQDVRSVQRVRD
jgi:hypothetical protein